MKMSQFFSLRRLLSGFTAVMFLVSVLVPTTTVYAGSDDPKDLQNKTLTKKPPPAGVDAEILEKRSSTTAALWLKRGDALYAKKSYAESVEFYEKAAEKGNEEGKEGLLKVASIYFENKQYPGAFDCYQKAVGNGSEEGKEGLLKVASIYFENKQYPEACECYKKGIEKEVEGAKEKLQEALSEWVIRGDDLYADAQVLEAFALYTQAAHYGNEEAKEKTSEFGVEAGDAYAAQGNQVEALKCYEQAAAYGSVKAKAKMRLVVPPVARGYEAIYQRFSKGILVYRPEPGSDVGKIELPIAELANPLEGTFDLSNCGDTGQYLSIATGYRKGKIAANERKVEIWITPRFLIEKNLQNNAIHFSDIMGDWDANKAPIGAFYTWGGWDDLEWYDYVTTQDMDTFSKDDFYRKWKASNTRDFHFELSPKTWKKFHVYFELKKD